MNFFKNKIALLILALTFGIQVIVAQLAGDFFHTVPLSGVMWLKIIGVGSTVVLFNEVFKWILRLINDHVREHVVQKNMTLWFQIRINLTL